MTTCKNCGLDVEAERADWATPTCFACDMAKTCRDAVGTFGASKQIGMLHEEVGELLSAINKYERGRVDKPAVAEEVADVLIMAEQMRVIYGAADVDAAMQRKLARLRERIEKYWQDVEKMGGDPWVR